MSSIYERKILDYNEDKDENFPNELLNFRVKHNISLKRMSEISGVAAVTLSYIENRSTQPERITIMKLRRAMEEYEKEGE